MTDSEIQPRIRNCFESGNVRKAFGKIEPDTYFLLIKNFRENGHTPGEPAEYFMNIALATTDREQFYSWIKHNEHERTPAELAELVKNTINVERSDPYGLVVAGRPLERLLASSFGSLFNLPDEDLKNDGPTFELVSLSDLEGVARRLSLEKPGWKLKQIVDRGGKWVRYERVDPPQRSGPDSSSQQPKPNWWPRNWMFRLKKVWILAGIVAGVILMLLLYFLCTDVHTPSSYLQ